MVRIKPFRGIRPPKNYAAEVASRPYDVLNSVEAKAEATERSLLHIIKPEIDFDPIADEHDPKVYEKAVENFRLWRERGWLVQDPEEYYYVYAQTMDGRTQYGLAMCCHFEDYLSGAIKKHELTRTEKEEDRMIHVRNQKANIEPVFFAYPDNAEIDAIVADVVANNAPEYDFTAEDGFGHKLWVFRDRMTNDRITEFFKGIPALYVADGHHRTAAAARVGAECRDRNPHHTGEEEYCYFLAVTFPASQLRIIDYNRVVKDLNGLTPAEFLERLKEDFTVEEKGTEIYRPQALHNFSMYLEGRWYSLTAKPGTYDDHDPIGVLDVTVLSNRVLDRILDIKDLRTSKRIDFVGGIRGLGELKRRVDSGEMQVAFALYPGSGAQRIVELEHHASEDNLVRTQAALGCGDPLLRGVAPASRPKKGSSARVIPFFIRYRLTGRYEPAFWKNCRPDRRICRFFLNFVGTNNTDSIWQKSKERSLSTGSDARGAVSAWRRVRAGCSPCPWR